MSPLGAKPGTGAAGREKLILEEDLRGASHDTARSVPPYPAALEPPSDHRAQAPVQDQARLGDSQQLKVAGRVRDLALFDCGIDAKLRGCDLVKLRVSDVAPGGSLRQRATVIQQKTGRPVPFEITDTTREALSAWLMSTGFQA